MNDDAGNRRGRPSITSISVFVLFVLPFVYVLSYAPVYRCLVSKLRYHPTADGWQVLYEPVEWLTDNTALREPLLGWAGLWGEYIEREFRLRSDLRMHGEDPYPNNMPQTQVSSPLPAALR